MVFWVDSGTSIAIERLKLMSLLSTPSLLIVGVIVIFALAGESIVSIVSSELTASMSRAVPSLESVRLKVLLSITIA